MSKTVLTAKVGDNSDLYTGFEEYRKSQDMTKSEALRALVRAGLRAESTKSTQIWMYLSIALVGFELGARVLAAEFSLSQGMAVFVAITVLMLVAEVGRQLSPRLVGVVMSAPTTSGGEP